jgi:hypothetical protein
MLSGGSSSSPPSFGIAAADQALSGSSEVNIESIKEKIEKDPSLARRDDESFQRWVKRLGIYSLVDDVHESRRFQLRGEYTDKVIKL